MAFQTHYTPSSSAFSSIDYDEELQQAVVTWRYSGQQSVVDNISPETMKEWLASPSLGHYYHENLKGD